MSHCLAETWLPILGTGIVFIIIGSSILVNFKNRISSLFFSRTTTITVIAYCLSSVSLMLFSGSLITLLWNIGFNESAFSILKIPIISTTIFEVFHICIDLLTILGILLTSLIVLSSFIFAQVLLHIFAKKLDADSDDINVKRIINQFPWLSKCVLNVIRDENPKAFAFTLLYIGVRKIRIEDRIVITTGMINLLTKNELEAVLAHEYSHTVNQDTRYSHLIVTISSLLFFDPICKLFKKIMLRNHEFKADMGSVQLVNKPKSLAKALYKIIAYNAQYKNMQPMKSPGLFDEDKDLIKERIQRLISYAKENNMEL